MEQTRLEICFTETLDPKDSKKFLYDLAQRLGEDFLVKYNLPDFEAIKFLKVTGRKIPEEYSDISGIILGDVAIAFYIKTHDNYSSIELEDSFQEVHRDKKGVHRLISAIENCVIEYVAENNNL